LPAVLPRRSMPASGGCRERVLPTRSRPRSAVSYPSAA
jgi:hypothetical protein